MWRSLTLIHLYIWLSSLANLSHICLIIRPARRTLRAEESLLILHLHRDTVSRINSLAGTLYFPTQCSRQGDPGASDTGQQKVRVLTMLHVLRSLCRIWWEQKLWESFSFLLNFDRQKKILVKLVTLGYDYNLVWVFMGLFFFCLCFIPPLSSCYNSWIVLALC